mgnify:CR=1 FL=1
MKPGRTDCRAMKAIRRMCWMALWLAGAVLVEPDGQVWAAAPGDATQKVTVKAITSIPPHAWMVSRIGGDRVAVGVLLRPGHSPATYTPSPAQTAKLARADVFFRVGVPFEGELLPRIQRSMDDLAVVDLRNGIDMRRMTSVTGHGHGHDGTQTGSPSNPDPAARESEPSGAPLDPHTWLDPRNAIRQCRTIRDALTAADPSGAERYRDRCRALTRELEAAHRRIARQLAPLAEKPMFVFHPAYGYFADAYGLKQIPIELEGKRPTPRALSRLIRLARTLEVGVIFVQPQFDTSSAKAVARIIDARVVVLDPLARDYITNLERIADRVRRALSETQGAS